MPTIAPSPDSSVDMTKEPSELIEPVAGGPFVAFDSSGMKRISPAVTG
jgi:hypothetical protein